MEETTRSRRRTRPEPTASQRALALQVRREHSSRELTRKLVARGVGRDEARSAVSALSEAGWQDDGRFAEFLARDRVQSGHGPRRIRAELKMHGLAARADGALASVGQEGGIDWVANARRLVRRRYPCALTGDAAARRRGAEFLLRRGFSVEHMRLALGPGGEDD